MNLRSVQSCDFDNDEAGIMYYVSRLKVHWWYNDQGGVEDVSTGLKNQSLVSRGGPVTLIITVAGFTNVYLRIRIRIGKNSRMGRLTLIITFAGFANVQAPEDSDKDKEKEG